MQVKSEDWDGQFIDLKEGDATAPDKSMLRIVYGPVRSQVARSTDLNRA